MNAERLASGLAIAAYAVATFAAMWITAHAYARDPFPDDMGTGVVVFLALVIFLLPLLAGPAIGRWRAVALVVWLVLATSVADGLEPLQREPPSEVEGSVTLLALLTGCIHIPLLLAGVGLRKLVRPRPPAELWRLT
jgi:hypothetical protein